MKLVMVVALLSLGILVAPTVRAERLGTGKPPHFAEITITEPLGHKVIRLGDTLRVSWKVTGKFSNPENWDLLVYLQACGVRRVPLFQGPLTKAPNHLNWVFTAFKMTEAMEMGDTTPMSVYVCVYNKHEGNDMLLTMSLGCKAALTADVFACETVDGNIELRP